MNFNERRDYVCPVCGRFFSSEDSSPSCDFCKNHNNLIIWTNVIEDIIAQANSLSPLEFQENIKLSPEDKFCLEKRKNDLREQNAIKYRAVRNELLYKKYVYNNPLFDQAKFDMRAEWEYEKAVEMEETYRKRQEEVSRPRCPKCGCTEFQMVPRKWSPLTGFLTNKVDRVCVKCKTRY